MKKKIIFFLAMLMIISTLVIACDGTKNEKILLTVSAATVKAGATVQLEADVSGVTFELIDSDASATIDTATGLITAKSDAAINAIIKAVAKKGSATSNTVQIVVVGDEIEQKILLSVASPSVKVGEAVLLTADTDGVTFSLIDGADHATINTTTGLITVKPDATVGTIIKAIATKGDIESNPVQILIIGEDTDEKILLTAAAPSVRAGGTVQLEADVDGAAYMLENPALATISSSGLLTVNAGISAGTIIKVTAQKNGVISNQIQILVVTDEKIVLSVSTPVAELGEVVELTSDVVGVTYWLIDTNETLVTETSNAILSTAGEVTVKNNAVIGAQIVAVAKKANVTSNEIKIIIVAGETEEKIVLTADKMTIQPEDTVNLSADVDDVEFMIVGDTSNATINSQTGVLTANDDAVIGSFIEVMATKGNTSSNRLKIVVEHIYATSITNVTATKTLLLASETTILSSTVLPNKTTQTVTYTIVNGYTKASILVNALTVTSDATPGTIVVMAKIGALTAFINLEVYAPLESITISTNKVEVAPGEIEIAPDGAVQFSAILAPSNTSETDINWEIISANPPASINQDGLLTIDSDATSATAIVVVAKRGTIISNSITVLVREISYGLINSTPAIVDSILTIKNTDISATPTLKFEVADDKGNPVHGMTIEYSILGEDGVVMINQLGEYCQVFQLTHGEATIQATLKDGDDVLDTDTVTIKSIKTPNKIILPEYLDTSLVLQGMTSYSVGHKQEFDFSVRIPGIETPGNANFGASADVSYTFELLGPDDEIIESGDVVGAVDDQKLTFQMMGRVRVTATTNSGNDGEEKSVDHIFDVNEYQNVDNFEDLKDYLQGGTAEDKTRGVNFVVTKKPSKDYGFSIVPFFMLALDDTGSPFTDSNIEKLKELYGDDFPGYSTWYFLEHIQIDIFDKNVIIRGNNHALDFSMMPLINYTAAQTLIEINGGVFEGGDHDSLDKEMLNYLAKSVGIQNPNLAPTLEAALNPEFTRVAPVYTVDFSNLKLFGNTDVNGKNLVTKNHLGGGTSRQGTHNKAIEIGYFLSRANFEVKMDNVEIKNFPKGMTIHRAVNEQYESLTDENQDFNGTYESKISNFRIHDIYSSGLEIAMSQIELHNANFGFTGAVPFEALSQFNTMAGLDEKKPQTIKFTGQYNPGVANKGDTQYYQDYTNLNVKFHQILNYVITDMSLNHKNHINFTGGAFGFVGFSLNDFMFEVGALSILTSIANGTYTGNLIVPREIFGLPNAVVGIQFLIASKMGGKLGKNFSILDFSDLGETVNLSTLESTGQDGTAAENNTAKYLAMDLSNINTGSFGLPYGFVNLGTVYLLNALYKPNN